MGRLTTHILDTANGIPAAGVAVRLYALGDTRREVASTRTNSDGRTDDALLDGAAVKNGSYELEFDMGEYFSARGADLSTPIFLNTVVIRFSVCSGEHYHVPLLVSPWSYSTYRGS